MVWSPPLQHRNSIIIVIDVVVILSNVVPVTVDVSVSVPVVGSIDIPWVFIKQVLVDPFLTDRFA